MTTNIMPITQQKAAKVAGITFLFSIIMVMVVNLGIVAPLIIKNDYSATIHNILSHEFLYRIGIAGNIMYSICVIVFLIALYIIQKKINQSFAIFASICLLISSLSWLLIALNQFTVIRLLNDIEFSNAFRPEGFFAMVKQYLVWEDIYYIGLLFWAGGCTVISCLFFKSKYIPRILSALGIISSAWCVVCTVIYYIFPNYVNTVNLWWFDSPMVLFELALSLWFLVKGLKLSNGNE